MRLLLVVLVALVMLAVGAPATLFDRAVSALTQDGLRLSAASGTIWHGGGVINVVDGGTRTWQPWCRVDWSFDPIGLFRGRASWKIINSGVNASRLDFGVSGVSLVAFRVSGPAQYFLQRVPGAFSGLGWSGDITLDVQSIECSWRGLCSGDGTAIWMAAGSGFLPGQVFGDYRMEFQASNGSYAIKWDSSGSSTVRTKGVGEISTAGMLRVDGEVKGEPLLLSRLPAVAGPWVRPTAAGDTWKIVYP